MLRCVGLIYVVIFAGVIAEGRALIGPHAISPISEYFATLKSLFPDLPERLLRAPSLFWLGTGFNMVAVLQWSGMAAAISIVFNFWPRMALFASWLVLLSFVSAWGLFTSTIDGKLLMLGRAFLCELYEMPP